MSMLNANIKCQMFGSADSFNIICSSYSFYPAFYRKEIGDLSFAFNIFLHITFKGSQGTIHVSHHPGMVMGGGWGPKYDELMTIL